MAAKGHSDRINAFYGKDSNHLSVVRKCSAIEGVELLAGAIRDFVYVLSGLVII